MQLKKLLQGSVFAAAAAVCVLAAPGVAQAADVTGTFTEAGVGEVKVDGTSATLEAKTSKPELLVGFGKVNTKNKTITVASWDSYEPGSNAAQIDLSKLNNTKDNYVVLTTPGASAVSIVKIPAVDKAIAATFDAATGKLSVGTAKTGKATAAVLTEGTDGTAQKYEYRTVYSGWTSLATSDNKVLDLTRYQQEGAKLFVRAKGSADSAALSKQGDEELGYGELKIKVYDGASLPGKEKAVTIAAKAKGPKVAVDYVKGTVKFPKNSQYRVATATAMMKSDKYIDGPTTATNVADIFDAAGKADTSLSISDTTTSLNLEVRTKAAGKKGNSKWTNVAIEKPAALSDTALKAITTDSSATITDPNCLNVLSGDDTAGWKSLTQTTAVTSAVGGTVKYGGCGVANAKVTDGASTPKDLVTVKYGKVNVKKSVGEVILEHKDSSSKTSYQVVVKDGRTAAIAATDKAYALKPGKSLTLKNLKTGQWIFIREAGDKKTQKWVGVYKVMGVVDIPYEKVVEKKATTTP